MFDLRDFVMRTLRGMAETEPGYKVNQYALGWFDRQVLTADDLAVVDSLTGVVEPEIEPIEPTPEEPVVEPAPDETTEPAPEEPAGEPEGGSDTGEITEEPIEPTPEGETGTEPTEPPAEEVTEPVAEGEPEGETV